MKITGKVKVKDNITTSDTANVVNNIVDSIIYKEGGEIIYQPYFFDDAVNMSVFVCLVEGIELEPEDKILDIIKNEKGVKKVLDDFITDNEYMVEVMGHAYDMIDFRKDLYLSHNDELDAMIKKAVEKENALNDILIAVAKAQNKILTQQAEVNEKQEEIFSMMSSDEIASMQKRIANGDFDMKDMVDAVVQKYMEADKDRDQKYKEIIDEKNKKIVDLTVNDHLKKGGVK